MRQELEVAGRAEPSTDPTEVSAGGKMRPPSEALCQVELGPAAGECGTGPKDDGITTENEQWTPVASWLWSNNVTGGMAGLVGCGRSDAADRGINVKVGERIGGLSERGLPELGQILHRRKI